jgi:acetyl esterase
MALNPQTAAFLAQLAAGADPEAAPIPLSPETSRAGYLGIAAAFGPGPSIQSVRDVTIPGSQGSIPLRIYQDHDKTMAPCLLYYHAGGWVIGDLDTHDHQCRQLAQFSQATIISVDYRLAPEHPFPAGHVDSLDALRYIANNPDSFNIDPERIAIGGDSAGGNLAAYLAICAREESISLVLQILLYPVTDARSYLDDVDTFLYPSINENIDSPLLTLETMRFFARETLCGLDHEKTVSDWRLSPILAEDLSNLAPAYIAVCEYDPLRDEGIAYATRLTEFGTSVNLSNWQGQIHLLMQLAPVIDDGHSLLEEVVVALRTAFEGSQA